VFVLNDIETFAEGINALASQYELKILSDWGNKLLQQIQTYDMENAPITLEYFPVIIKKISDLVADPDK
jgi:hypothetical protein